MHINSNVIQREESFVFQRIQPTILDFYHSARNIYDVHLIKSNIYSRLLIIQREDIAT